MQCANYVCNYLRIEEAAENAQRQIPVVVLCINCKNLVDCDCVMCCSVAAPTLSALNQLCLFNLCVLDGTFMHISIWLQFILCILCGNTITLLGFSSVTAISLINSFSLELASLS